MGRQIGAVILAAGQGKRMHTKVAKQFLELKGKPLLCHTLEAFEKSQVDHIVLVAGEDQVCYCEKEIVQAWGFSKVKAVVPGGKERYLGHPAALSRCLSLSYPAALSRCLSLGRPAMSFRCLSLGLPTAFFRLEMRTGFGMMMPRILKGRRMRNGMC